MIGTITTKWFDAEREPQVLPDPAYPNGIDLDVSMGAPDSCVVQLKYPAKRCGYYLISCRTCRQGAIATTAGRADDPRSIKLACKRGEP